MHTGLRFGRGGRRSRFAAAAAALGTVFDIIPAVGPSFAPSEGETADRTNFRGKVGLGALAGHSRGTKSDSNRACKLVVGGMGRSAAAAVDGSYAGMQHAGVRPTTFARTEQDETTSRRCVAAGKAQ